ncbi:hypothetical protein PGT21_035833 [Puccinia graminis f. sp. tritici]|uniref:Uncharacterized protein n=1 Tax=Puccinia graminis f. sp. tritici TaxID=56615 RepID=A0A5B0RXN6_PUCGR|nr:hypothetical protein PGT21_035833 [Puccinia graminis f. sp. tritici]KAA1130182.1 hypothetical protein PGTUg99_015405 [Puccinia graminis f. sp. tritici]
MMCNIFISLTFVICSWKAAQASYTDLVQLANSKESLPVIEENPAQSLAPDWLLFNVVEKVPKKISNQKESLLVGEGDNSSNTLMNSGEDILWKGISSPSLEELTAESDNKKGPRMDRKFKEDVKRIYLINSHNIVGWKTDFDKIHQYFSQSVGFELKPKMATLVRAISNLFEKIVNEQGGHSNDFKAKGENLPTDIPTLIFETWEEIWIGDIHELNLTWKYLNEKDKIKGIFLIRNGINLVLNIFHDLQKHEIITKESLSDFMNTKNGPRLILDYAIMGFHLSVPTAEDAYSNFNLKLSLQHGPATERTAEIFKLLNNETWKWIEFEYLRARFNYSADDLDSTKSEFLVVASPNNKEPSEKGIEEVFIKLATQISQSTFPHGKKCEQNLINLKEKYDIK